MTVQQMAEVIAGKLVIYDGFQAALAGGVPKEAAVAEIAQRYRAWVDIFAKARREQWSM